MSTLKVILFLAKGDLKVILKERNTIMWLFLMPGIFFYFIGTVTQGGLSLPTEQAVGLLVNNQDRGFLGAHVEKRLEENLFEVLGPDEAPRVNQDGEELFYRTLTIPADFTEKIIAKEEVLLTYVGLAQGILNDYDLIRLQKAAYTALGDVMVASLGQDPPSEEAISNMLTVEALTTLEVKPAGQRQHIPSGFEQTIPGTLVMFTLLVLLTSGAASLVHERDKQLLRRLASAPFTRGQIVAGKWAGRMALATVQIGVALAIGTFVPIFDMNWGGALPMVIVILLAWGALCTSLAVLLGSIGKTEGQVSGLGVLASMMLAALGGCWWPIEVAPDWMQDLQMFIPAGWTMDAMHKLISFGADWTSVLPNLAILLVATLAVGWLAARKFRFI